MVIQTIQTVINIGSSKGVTLPSKDLKLEGIKTGDGEDLRDLGRLESVLA